ITTIPSIGFNVETVAFGKNKLTLWDVGTGSSICMACCGIKFIPTMQQEWSGWWIVRTRYRSTRALRRTEMMYGSLFFLCCAVLIPRF
ncbi:hypothetical protein BDZ89DRAFT_974963, partial [Hymenopellis radicata]